MIEMESDIESVKRKVEGISFEDDLENLIRRIA